MKSIPAARLEPQWSAQPTPFRHSWRGLGNVDQFRWLSRADVLRHLQMARDDLGVRHVRAVAMYSPELFVWDVPLPEWDKPDAKKRREANWQLVDISLENLLDLGLKPIYTTCFTPPGFSDRPGVCWSDRNPVGMPRDLDQWGQFVAAGVRHHMKRYGRDEVRSWYFECWNEPNLAGFFDGTMAEYFRLWSVTWRAVKSVDSELRIGGPSTARGEWVGEFLDWAIADGAPPDYLIAHVYNNDSEHAPLSPFDGPASHRVKDSPHFATGVIRGLRRHLDGRGWRGELHWNEWGRSWFPHDPSRETVLEAAFIVKTMAEVSQDADGFGFWCLSDIYNQAGLQSSEFQGHYGMLSLHGLRKPAWFAHMLLNRMGNQTVPVTGGTPLINAVATTGVGKASLLIYAYPHAPHIESQNISVELCLSEPAARISMTRLGATENNIIAKWKMMGAPAYPTRPEIEALRGANVLAKTADRLLYNPDDRSLVTIGMECPGVACVELEF